MILPRGAYRLGLRTLKTSVNYTIRTKRGHRAGSSRDAPEVSLLDTDLGHLYKPQDSSFS